MTTKVIHVVQSDEGERYIKLKYGDDAVIAKSMVEAMQRLNSEPLSSEDQLGS